eukprot:scaffold24490_cov60-Phaeocystis_antarctica.AAC.4
MGALHELRTHMRHRTSVQIQSRLEPTCDLRDLPRYRDRTPRGAGDSHTPARALLSCDTSKWYIEIVQYTGELARVGLAGHQVEVELVGLLDDLDRLGRVERLLLVAEAVDRLVCERERAARVRTRGIKRGGKRESMGAGEHACDLTLSTLPPFPLPPMAVSGLAGGASAPSGVLYQRNHSRMPETVPG